jgi:hypothetical protein
LAPVINERVSCLSFHLEDKEQLVPYGYIGELLGYKKEAPEQVDVQENMLEEFLGMILGEDNKEPKISPCRDFFRIEYMKQGKFIIRDERRRYKLTKINVPLPNMRVRLNADKIG